MTSVDAILKLSVSENPLLFLDLFLPSSVPPEQLHVLLGGGGGGGRGRDSAKQAPQLIDAVPVP